MLWGPYIYIIYRVIVIAGYYITFQRCVIIVVLYYEQKPCMLSTIHIQWHAPNRRSSIIILKYIILYYAEGKFISVLEIEWRMNNDEGNMWKMYDKMYEYMRAGNVGKMYDVWLIHFPHFPSYIYWKYIVYDDVTHVDNPCHISESRQKVHDT